MTVPRTAVCAVLALGAAGCESTQSRSARLESQAAATTQRTGLRITQTNRDVRVAATSVLSDENGAAVVVDLRNASGRDQASVPVAIDVLGAEGGSVFRNDAPGIERALSHVALIEAGAARTWVHDQVSAPEPPKEAKVRVGPAGAEPPEKPPSIATEDVALEEDAVSGAAARGFVRNESAVAQRGLVVFGVARRGDRVVAAGRAVVRLLRPRARARFQLFFIGDPRGAELELWAPPTILREEP